MNATTIAKRLFVFSVDGMAGEYMYTVQEDEKYFLEETRSKRRGIALALAKLLRQNGIEFKSVSVRVRGDNNNIDFDIH